MELCMHVFCQQRILFIRILITFMGIQHFVMQLNKAFLSVFLAKKIFLLSCSVLTCKNLFIKLILLLKRPVLPCTNGLYLRLNNYPYLNFRTNNAPVDTNDTA